MFKPAFCTNNAFRNHCKHAMAESNHNEERNSKEKM